jgi:hypothetical protein
MTEPTMNAGPRSVRSSTKDQISISGRSRVTFVSGSFPGAYCVAHDETVKVVRLDLFAEIHVCSPPCEACSKHSGRGQTLLTLRRDFSRLVS